MVVRVLVVVHFALDLVVGISSSQDWFHQSGGRLPGPEAVSDFDSMATGGRPRRACRDSTSPVLALFDSDDEDFEEAPLSDEEYDTSEKTVESEEDCDTPHHFATVKSTELLWIPLPPRAEKRQHSAAT